MAGTPITQLLPELDIPHDRDVPLAPLTWYGVGGPAAVLARPQSEQDLSTLVRLCREQDVPLYVLGSGANLLVRDSGVPGVVVRLDAPAFAAISFDGDRVTVGAGYDLMKLVLELAKRGLSGLEGVAGIPATVGGAVRMNAGGAFGDVGSSVRRVRVMDHGGAIATVEGDAMQFSYRHSSITQPFILDVTFQLTPADAQQAMQRVKQVFLYKKNSQPMGQNSAGCAFKNPGPQQPAGKLIDQCGLKGFTIGSAHVSTVHANFIVVEKDGGQADDVYAVMQHVEEQVLQRFGVRLEREVVVWP